MEFDSRGRGRDLTALLDALEDASVREPESAAYVRQRLASLQARLGLEAKGHDGDAFREMEARFRAIFDAAPVGIEVSRDGRVLFANRLCAKLLGYDEPDELVGASLCERIDPAQATVRERVCSPEPVEAEYESVAVRRDGTSFPLLLNVIRVRLPDGPAAMVFFRDLTEREQARAARERVEAQLRHAQKMEAIGTLAGGIAHDFNNILTPIVAHCDLALAEVDELSPVYEDLAAISVAVGRARALVKQMLAISRREEVRSSLHPVDLGKLIREAVRLLRAALPSTIQIDTRVEPDCGCVLGDVTHLHQVLLNLCTNARDAMEGGGTLTLSLTRERGESTVGRSTERIKLAVRDTGGGIAPEMQQRIFEPYFTTKPSGKGTGLGLAVVHGIVTRMGGELTVQSAVGEGTTFEVMLPRYAFAAEDASMAPSAWPPMRMVARAK